MGSEMCIRDSGCGAGLAGGEPVGDPVRHQVWELPAAVCLVTEHQRMRVKCACCGKVTLAGVPTGIPAGAFGPNAGWQISTPLTPALGSSSRLISGLVPVHDPLDRIAAVISKRLPVLLGFCLLAFGLAGVGVAATAFGKSPSKRPLCVRYKCTTLAADPQVGVYQAANKHRNREVEYQSSFARWIPSGRVTALGDYCNFECVTLQKLALAGRFLLSAFTEGAERYPGSGVGGGWYLSLLNVQTGRRQKVDPVGGKEGGFGKGSPGVTDVVVTPAGTAAWIIDGEYQNPTGPSLPGNQGELPLGSKSLFELAPGSRTPVVLATSSTIDPTSLAAIPGHLYWIEGGTPRTASIQ